jgi:NifU-like protein
MQGKTLEEVQKITNQDIAEALGGLPPEKMHCSVMGQEALEAAIANYRGQAPPTHEEGEVICQCFGVTDKEIEKVAKANNLHTVEDITNYTKAGGGCGKCVDQIAELLAQIWEQPIEASGITPTPPPKKKLTILQKIKLIEETLEREVRPALQHDGGDIELIDIGGGHGESGLKGHVLLLRGQPGHFEPVRAGQAA